ncbi:MAG: hypothetical protein M3O30_17435 [Planctomycetota bacterium]|nr:hypothetical protein [Planctomycetota bacterium]
MTAMACRTQMDSVSPHQACMPETLGELAQRWQRMIPGRQREEMFARLHARALPVACRIYRMLCRERMAQDRDAAESDINLRIFRTAREYDGRGQFETLLFRSVLNAVKDWRKLSARQEAFLGETVLRIDQFKSREYVSNFLPPILHRVDAGLTRRDDANRWERISRRLTAAEKHAYRKRFGFDWRLAQIAKSLDRWHPRSGKWTVQQTFRAIKRAAGKMEGARGWG